MISEPMIPERLIEASLEDTIAQAIDEGSDIELMRFYGEALPAFEGEALEFRSCIFERCSFNLEDAERLVFVDCVFDRCDTSSMNFYRSTFQRVEFFNCRMTGVQFSNGTIFNALFQDCQMDFANFSEIKAQHLLFQRCAIKESMFYKVNWMDWSWQDCNLTRAEFPHTLLKGMDVSACEIDGMITDLPNLRGLKVTAAQALALSGLLGLVIRTD